MDNSETDLCMKSVGRNDPCPCGSGRKYKKCCINKRPRAQYVYVGHREPFQGMCLENHRVSVELASGETMEADHVFSQTQYVRKRGTDKVLTSVPDHVVFNTPLFLASRFDLIWAIDTNTKLVRDDLVSVSCVLECRAKRASATQIRLDIWPHGYMAFRNCPRGSPERFAWSKLVRMTTRRPGYRRDLRVAVITDHDLTNHAKYNSGKLPIYDNLYLPSSFTLLYASSDSGQEDVLNTLLVRCDRDARGVLRQLEREGSAIAGDSVIAIDSIPDLRAD